MIAKVPDQEFDYERLDAGTRDFVWSRAGEIHNLARTTAASIVQIGKYLTEVKEQLPHGEFLKWIQAEFDWSRHSAVAFMQVHEQFKCRNFQHLQIDVSALYLIAKPSTPARVREEVIRRAESGERITRSTALQAIQKLIREEQPLPSPEQAREMAIETGKHVLDSDGWYQPPVTVEVQEEASNALDLFETIREFSGSDLLQYSPTQLFERFERLRWPHVSQLPSLKGFISWLTEFEDERLKRFP